MSCKTQPHKDEDETTEYKIPDNDENLECAEYSVIDMLFRLIGMKQVDSIVFFDRATDTQRGVEVIRTDIEALCEKQIKRAQFGLQKLNESKHNADIA